MIIEYHRPKTIQEVLELLSRQAPLTVPLAGGTALDRNSETPIAVVDLQTLGLNMIKQRGNYLEVGATATLHDLLEAPVAEALRQAIRLEATYNLRQMATVGGTIAAAGGRSSLATALLALDASLAILPDEESLGFGELLPLRSERLRGKLITSITLPTTARLAFEMVARTPADLPIVCAALAAWPSGRVRLTLGGFGDSPTLAFDGGEAVGLSEAARSAFAQAGDQWASAEYRREMAGLLAERCLNDLSQ